MSSKKNKTTNHTVDYIVTALLTCILLVVLAFWFIDDVQTGVSVIFEQIVHAFFPDLLS